jgi:CRP-like cAMP-binding protein
MARSSNPARDAIGQSAVAPQLGLADPHQAANILAAFLATYGAAASVGSLPQWQMQTAPIGQLIEPPVAVDVTGLWLVVAGQVRLLVWDAAQQKNVSIELLSPGEVFGFESLLPAAEIEGDRVYQAIAASDCQCLYLPQALTQNFLTQVVRSDCQSDLGAIAKMRSRLAFFRTQTAIGSPTKNPTGKILTPPQLQQLMPRLTRHELAAGSDLSQIEGRCWLVSGTVDSDGLRQVGDAWTMGPGDRAVTPVCLYQLPADDWAMLSALIPALAQAAVPIDPVVARSTPAGRHPQATGPDVPSGGACCAAALSVPAQPQTSDSVSAAAMGSLHAV